MKKTFFYIVLMLLGISTQSQDLPTVAPVSPEAASLGKFGDLPVNLATGRLGYNVPIFTIDVGGFKVPISLSYNNGGLLAEEDAGVAGLGWNLNAGGRIVRQLRGGADEEGTGYLGGSIGKDWVIPYNFGVWDNLPTAQREAKIEELYYSALNSNWDLQPDKFIINANGISGSFSYNELGSPVFYPQKNYLLTKTNGNYNVVSSSGVMYDFNQKETTMGEEMTTDNPNLSNYVSSWGLTKIAFPTNDKEITFSYSTNSSYIKSSFSESKRIRTTTTGANDGVCQNTSNQITSGEYVTTIANKINISQINFPQGSVDFDIRDVLDVNSNTTSYLHSITVKDIAGTIVTKYTFEYDNVNSTRRLLQRVKKYDSENNEIPYYSFDYYGTPPVNINYGSQDLWGFYNAKQGNNLFSNDRGIDFNAARLGALKKVHYPTKGFSEITYESNRVMMHVDTYKDIQIATQTTSTHNSSEFIDLTTSGNNSKTITIPSNQFIKVSMVTEYQSGNGDLEAEVEVSSPLALECQPYNPVGDNCFVRVQTFASNGSTSGANPNQDLENYFYVQKNQQVTISALLNTENVSGRAYIKVEYFVPTTQEEIEDFTEVIINNDTYITPRIGGIRVASTSDCSASGDCIGKTYDYIQSNGKTSGQLLISSPVYSHVQNYVDDALGSCSFTVTSYASKIPSASFQGSPVLYERVEVLQNGTDANGKTVLTFSNEENASPSFPFLPINTKDWRKGNLLTETKFAKKNGALVEVSKTTNNYGSFYPFPSSLTSTDRSVGMNIGRSHFRYLSNGSELLSVNDLNERSFNNRPEFYQLLSTTKQIDGITTTSNYQYDALNGNSKEVTTSNSNGDELKEKKYYALDVADASLIAQNRISEVVKTESFKAATKLLTQKTVYENFAGNYLPKKTQISKQSEDFQDGIIYHGYYDDGNIKEVSKEDGTHIVYIWGYYGTLPIAKIENATFSDIPTTFYNQVIAASNTDADTDPNSNPNVENNLRVLQNALREHPNLSNALVTTYTFDPLKGVTSITDPRGESVFYHYDDAHRLQYVKNKEGQVLSENQYNYKN